VEESPELEYVSVKGDLYASSIFDVEERYEEWELLEKCVCECDLCREPVLK
jgi:hypothetical protein